MWNIKLANACLASSGPAFLTAFNELRFRCSSAVPRLRQPCAGGWETHGGWLWLQQLSKAILDVATRHAWTEDWVAWLEDPLAGGRMRRRLFKQPAMVCLDESCLAHKSSGAWPLSHQLLELPAIVVVQCMLVWWNLWVFFLLFLFSFLTLLLFVGSSSFVFSLALPLPAWVPGFFKTCFGVLAFFITYFGFFGELHLSCRLFWAAAFCTSVALGCAVAFALALPPLHICLLPPSVDAESVQSQVLRQLWD